MAIGDGAIEKLDDRLYPFLRSFEDINLAKIAAIQAVGRVLHGAGAKSWRKGRLPHPSPMSGASLSKMAKLSVKVTISAGEPHAEYTRAPAGEKPKRNGVTPVASRHATVILIAGRGAWLLQCRPQSAGRWTWTLPSATGWH